MNNSHNNHQSYSHKSPHPNNLSIPASITNENLNNNPPSQDIFYLVKKQILDKLDIILQKINLRVIDYINPKTNPNPDISTTHKKHQQSTPSASEHHQQKQKQTLSSKPTIKNFKFIELSSFERQIKILFQYLDRLYSSLNSSISYSSADINHHIGDSNINGQNSNNTSQPLISNQLLLLKEQNLKLSQEIQKLKSELKLYHLKEQNNPSNDFQIYHNTQSNSQSITIPNQQLQSLEAWKSNLCKQCLSLYQKYSPSLFNSKTIHTHSRLSNNSNLNHHNKSSSKALISNPSIDSFSEIQRNVSNIKMNSNPNMTTQNPNGISMNTVKKILKFYNHNIKVLADEFKQFQRWVKKILKEEKFHIVENRVECIATMKKSQEQQQEQTRMATVQGGKASHHFHEQNTAAIVCCEYCDMPVASCRVNNSEITNICDAQNSHQEKILQELEEILDLC